MRYCVYVHYRPDKNIPFYVGKASISKNGTYQRSRTSSKRNSIWRKIYLKNNKKFTVSEVFYSDDEQECLNTESKIIRRIGCIFDNSGPLANLEELSNTHKSNVKKVYEVDSKNNILKTYNSVADVAREMNVDCSMIALVCRRRSKGYDKSCHGRLFTYEIVDITTQSKRISDRNKNPVIAIKGDLRLEFKSIEDCSRELEISYHAIHKNTKGVSKNRKGWTFEYKIKNWYKQSHSKTSK